MNIVKLCYMLCMSILYFCSIRTVNLSSPLLFPRDYNIHFLSFRFWIGAWVSLCLLIIVLSDLSALVRYITRFTEECFTVLVSLIFIYEAFAKLFAIRHQAPVGSGVAGPGSGCYCENNGTETNNLTVVNDSLAASMYDECLTYKGRFVVGVGCISPDDCVYYGWVLTGQCDNLPVPDVFFFSLLLFIGTFGVAMALRNFRTTPFFPSVVSDLS